MFDVFSVNLSRVRLSKCFRPSRLTLNLAVGVGRRGKSSRNDLALCSSGGRLAGGISRLLDAPTDWHSGN
jgi:hypothetical protein